MWLFLRVEAARNDQVLNFIRFDMRAEWELPGEQPRNCCLASPWNARDEEDAFHRPEPKGGVGSDL